MAVKYHHTAQGGRQPTGRLGPWRTASEPNTQRPLLVFDLPPWFVETYGPYMRKQHATGALKPGDELVFKANLMGKDTEIILRCKAIEVNGVVDRLEIQPHKDVRHKLFREEFRRYGF